MSIIEKALGKFHSTPASKLSRPNSTAEQVIPHSIKVGRVPVSGTDGRPRTTSRLVPRESVSVDLGVLRAASMVPSAGHAADVLTHELRRIKWPLLESVAARTRRDAPPANLIMIASSVSGEGKTFMALNLALSLAREEDFSVLLIDADVSRHQTTTLLGLDARQGLMDAIANPQIVAEDLVVGTGIHGLSVLPSGRRSAAAPELFASQRMTEVMRTLGNRDPHRIILLDSSPLLVTNEAQVLARTVDQVVLLVKSESTTQPMVLDAIGLLDKSKQIRCVLSQSKTSKLLEYAYGPYPYGQSKED